MGYIGNVVYEPWSNSQINKDLGPKYQSNRLIWKVTSLSI
jgi:hypothetical protein